MPSTSLLQVTGLDDLGRLHQFMLFRLHDMWSVIRLTNLFNQARSFTSTAIASMLFCSTGGQGSATVALLSCSNKLHLWNCETVRDWTWSLSLLVNVRVFSNELIL